MHNQTFAFESDFVDTLRCIPMAVRMKLDACGIKLTLRQWSLLWTGDRRELLDTPCQTDSEVSSYRARLCAMVDARTGTVASALAPDQQPLWPCSAAPPQQVVDFARDLGLRAPAHEHWRALSSLQRFALGKLSRASHDNVNFVPALREFGLLEKMKPQE
jgi:hypothetical protein